MTNPQASTLARLDDQIHWYSRHARGSQLRYRIASTLELVIAASIVVISAANLRVFDFALPAVLAALLTIVKGVETTWQWQSKWANYRATVEALKREKYLYAANAGPYASDRHAAALLAERIEEIISRENLDWMVRAHASTPNTEPSDRAFGASPNETHAMAPVGAVAQDG